MSRRLVIAIVATVAGSLMVIGALVGYALVSNEAPQKVADTVRDAVLQEDSGVVACRALAESIKESETTDDTADVFTEDEYKAVRKMFADSKHATIRDHGTQLIDLGWQMEQMTDENGDVGMEAFALLGPFMEAYSGLAGGCSEQDVPLPPLDFGEAR